MATQIYTNSVTLSDAAEGNKWDTAAYPQLTGVAGTNTITATGPANLTLATSPPLWFVPAATNSGATTINITPSGGAALGAKNVFYAGAACVGGELKISVPALIVYDGTQYNIVANSLGIPVSLIDAAGDGIIGTAADTAGRAALIYGKIIHGLTYDNGTDATNDININTGGAMDATGARWMRLATALGKQSDVAWAVGGTTAAPAGWLDTGAVGNSDYYIWLIARSDTGVVDSLCSLSSTAPTMPANYDFKHLIGWFKRVGGTIVAFTTYETEGGGIEMNWAAPTLDVAIASTLTTSRRTDAVKVPLNFSVLVHLSVYIFDASAEHVEWVGCPDETDAAPSKSAARLTNYAATANDQTASSMWVRTSAAGLIAARSTLATVDTYNVSTEGFRWARRN